MVAALRAIAGPIDVASDSQFVAKACAKIEGGAVSRAAAQAGTNLDALHTAAAAGNVPFAISSSRGWEPTKTLGRQAIVDRCLEGGFPFQESEGVFLSAYSLYG